MCSHRHWFYYYTSLANPIKIILGDNSTIPAIGQGHIIVNMNTDGHRKRVILQDILYALDLGGNLLSVSHLAHHGAEMRFKGETCKILDQLETVMCLGHLHGNLYVMDMEVESNEHAKIATISYFPSKGDDPPNIAMAACMRSSEADLNTWHRHLGHLNVDAVTLLVSRGMVTRIEITKGTTIRSPCKPCMKGKANLS